MKKRERLFVDFPCGGAGSSNLMDAARKEHLLLEEDRRRLDFLQEKRCDLLAVVADDHEGNPTRKLWVLDFTGIEGARDNVRDAIDVGRCGQKEPA